MKIETIEAEYGLELPNSYKEFVRGIGDYWELYFNDEPEDEDDFPGRPWMLWGLERLTERFEMKSAGNASMFSVLRLYTKVFTEMTGTNSVYSPDGMIPIQQIAGAFTFAEENGDYLYMDPKDSWSVWIYFHDGGDVKRVSTSFKGWLSATEDA